LEALQHPKSEDMSLVAWQKELRPDAIPRERLEQLGEAIAELSAHIDAATFRLLCMIAEFDRNSGWGEGFQSCAHWLSWRVGWCLGTARERVRVARALEELPLISDALRKGEVSYSKVRAMTRIARPDNEENLLVMARDGTAGHLEKLVRYSRRYAGDEEQDQVQRQRQKQYLQTYTDEDGMVVVRGRLPPEVGAMLQQALNTAADALRRQQWEEERKRDEDEDGEKYHTEPEDVERSMRVEALGLVAEQALKSGLIAEPADEEAGSGKRAAQPKNLVVVHVDAEVLADPKKHGRSYVEDVGRVSAETSRRLACDAQVVEIFEDELGHVLDVGRRSRRVTVALAQALQERDPTCRYPGCCRTRHLNVHHIDHWAAGGETNLGQILHLCKYHHGLVHEGGFTVEGTGDAPVFRNPRGRRIEPSPPLGGVGDRPVEALVISNEGEGLAITPESNRITWAGEAIEWGWAVEALMPE